MMPQQVSLSEVQTHPSGQKTIPVLVIHTCPSTVHTCPSSMTWSMSVRLSPLVEVVFILMSRSRRRLPM